MVKVVGVIIRTMEVFIPEALGVGSEPFIQPEVGPIPAGHQISPPLVRGLVNRDRLLEKTLDWSEMQLFPLLVIKKGVRRKKDEAGPSLAFASRHLSQGQLAVWKRTQPLGEVPDGSGRRLSDDHFMLCR